MFIEFDCHESDCEHTQCKVTFIWLIFKIRLLGQLPSSNNAKDMKGKPSDAQIETALAQAFVEIDRREKGPSKHFFFKIGAG